MGHKGKFILSQDHGDVEDIDERPGAGGRTEFDENGDTVRLSNQGLGRREALARLLNDERLQLAQEAVPAGSAQRIQENAGGLKKGYDPYDSGRLVKKEWKKKRDMRALSKWIQQKKHFEPDE